MGSKLFPLKVDTVAKGSKNKNDRVASPASVPIHHEAFTARNNLILETQSTLDISVEVHSKLLISPSKFSGPRKFTLRYQ